MKYKIIALFGESGAGKDTIARQLINSRANTNLIIPYTTRPQREYEREGIDYYFVSDNILDLAISSNCVLEYTTFNNWRYATCLPSLIYNKINVGIFNPNGIRQLLSYKSPDRELSILPVWIKTNDKVRLSRAIGREYNPDCEEICRRFLADKNDFKNIDFSYSIFVNNMEIYQHNFIEYCRCFWDEIEIQNFIQDINE